MVAFVVNAESPSKAVRAIEPGTLIAGKYRVERLLGAGGMGVVVAARHLDLGELRAVKLLGSERCNDAGAIERFLREARAAAALRCEHIVTVHDVERLDSGEPFIVMEYLEGLDLAQLLAVRGLLAVEEAVGIVLQVLEALAVAHAAGTVHRDLKPANLFVLTEPLGQMRVKVLDFGVAKLGEAARQGLDTTHTGALLGSPLYMSPEQMQASKHVDARSDIWSLGVILYELLTGEVPFRGPTITAQCAKVLQEPAPRMSLRRGDLPPGLEPIVLQCLAKEPADRFADAARLAVALMPFGPPGSAQRVAAITRAPVSGGEAGAAEKYAAEAYAAPPAAHGPATLAAAQLSLSMAPVPLKGPSPLLLTVAVAALLFALGGGTAMAFARPLPPEQASAGMSDAAARRIGAAVDAEIGPARRAARNHGAPPRSQAAAPVRSAAAAPVMPAPAPARGPHEAPLRAERQDPFGSGRE